VGGILEISAGRNTSGETKVLAYITTLCTHVAVQQFDQQAVVDGFRYQDYPAIKLARLAVDASLQGQGIGSQLVDFVIGLVAEHIMPYTGCRFLVVDAKSTSVSFYERKGFTKIGRLDGDDQGLTSMFVDMRKLSSKPV
jgi:GNAT superfamily N-acetyltransferase